MRKWMALAFGGILALSSASTAYADVQITMHDGRVSLVAKDATVRQILEAWAKIGQTKIVNVERITGGPVTLQFTEMPEMTALEVLLRSVSGYVAAPRPTPLANASAFDRILVMPTSVAPVAPSAPARPAPFQPPTPPQFNQPQFNQPGQVPPPADDDQDDERPAPNVPGRGPVFNTFPQPQIVNPQQGGPTRMPSMPPPQQQQLPPGQLIPNTPTTPGAPVSPFGGTSMPGVIVQPPPQPGAVPGAPPRR